MPKKKTTTKPDFETALSELEALVEKMEQGDLSLEDSMQQYERGVALSQQCQSLLETAEQKVQILTKNNQLKAFDPEAE
jgi:exodeoxyribonuclease VII small subunit